MHRIYISDKGTVTVLVERAVEQGKRVGKFRVAIVHRVVSLSGRLVCHEELPTRSGRCGSVCARLVTGTEGKRDTGRRQRQAGRQARAGRFLIPLRLLGCREGFDLL